MKMNDRLSLLLSEAGAVAFGSAPASPVDDEEWAFFQSWLDNGFHAGMAYMENYPDIRRDPRRLLDGARSVISVAFNYRQPNPFPGIATYAIGRDYHRVLRRRLKYVVRGVREEFGGEWRICIDSAPILERYWAEKCSIGRRSPVHGNIVVPGVGSMVFLAEIITSLEIDGLKRDCPSSLPPMAAGWGGCPTGALRPGGVVDSNLCINYLTIEKKAPLTGEEQKLIGRARFGCDICQRTSEENQGAFPGVIPEFEPLPGLEEFLRGQDGDFDLSASPLSRNPGFKPCKC